MNVDRFSLDLMQRVWSIVNEHGPDCQRKAKIQIAIAEAFTRFNSQFALAQAAHRQPKGWSIQIDSTVPRGIHVSSPAGNHCIVMRTMSAPNHYPANMFYDLCGDLIGLQPADRADFELLGAAVESGRVL